MGVWPEGSLFFLVAMGFEKIDGRGRGRRRGGLSRVWRRGERWMAQCLWAHPVNRLADAGVAAMHT